MQQEGIVLTLWFHLNMKVMMQEVSLREKSVRNLISFEMAYFQTSENPSIDFSLERLDLLSKDYFVPTLDHFTNFISQESNSKMKLHRPIFVVRIWAFVTTYSTKHYFARKEYQLCCGWNPSDISWRVPIAVIPGMEIYSRFLVLFYLFLLNRFLRHQHQLWIKENPSCKKTYW